MKTGLFIGSFDPFTIGHDAVVRRALPLFDRIVIGVGVNERKKYMYSPDVRVKSIAELYAAESRIEVKAYNDLAVEFARLLVHRPSLAPCFFESQVAKNRPHFRHLLVA